MGKPRAPAQGGILQGANPSVYDPKNPIIIFIIQVCWLSHLLQCNGLLSNAITGRHHHHLLPPSPPASLEDQTTTSHCGSHRWHIARALRHGPHTGFHGCHLSHGIHAHLELGRQCWLDPLPLPRRTRGRPTTHDLKLEDSAERWGGWNGSTFWLGLCHSVRSISPISRGFGPQTDQLWNIHVVHWRRLGHHCKCPKRVGPPPPPADALKAFPVLCRILTELKLLQSQVGVVVLSAGVSNDVIGWILLALCVALVNAGSGITALYVLLTCVAWVLFLVYAVRPLFMIILRRTGSLNNGPTQSVVALTVLLVFTSAFFTGIIGVHPIFGAFLVGLICPHEGGFAIKLTEKIEDLVAVFFLPLYFALSGLSTNLGLLDTGITWAYVIGVIAVAFVAKVAGGTIAARANKMVWRESFTIGVLMSCKGLVELIVLVSQFRSW